MVADELIPLHKPNKKARVRIWWIKPFLKANTHPWYNKLHFQSI